MTQGSHGSTGPGAGSGASEALLDCGSARIAREGVLVDQLQCRAAADRVALIGHWRPLFQLLAAEARVTEGHVRLSGEEAARAVYNGSVGLVPCDVRMIPRWRGAEFLRHSARLAGLSRREASRAASEVLSALGLDVLGSKLLRNLRLVERRALLLAHAMLGDPPIIACETPMERLDESARAWLGQIVGRAQAGRRWLVSFPGAPELGAEYELFSKAEWCVVLAEGKVVAEGVPGSLFVGGLRYLLRAGGNGEALVRRLGELGISTAPLPGASHQGTGDSGIAPGWIVELAPNETPTSQLDSIMAEAARLGVPITQLSPLYPAGSPPERVDRQT